MSEREFYPALPAGEPRIESDDILISEAPSRYVLPSLSGPKPDLDHKIEEVTYSHNPQDILISLKPASSPEPNPISNLLNRGFSLEQLHPFIKNQPPVSEELVLEERTLYSLPSTDKPIDNELEIEHQIIEKLQSYSGKNR